MVPCFLAWNNDTITPIVSRRYRIITSSAPDHHLASSLVTQVGKQSNTNIAACAMIVQGSDRSTNLDKSPTGRVARLSHVQSNKTALANFRSQPAAQPDPTSHVPSTPVLTPQVSLCFPPTRDKSPTKPRCQSIYLLCVRLTRRATVSWPPSHVLVRHICFPDLRGRSTDPLGCPRSYVLLDID